MFEFSLLGVVILVVGLTYLATVGRWLTPARIPVDADLIEEFDLEDHLTAVRVREDSAPVGLTVDELEARTEANVRVLQLRRNGATAPHDETEPQVLEYEETAVEEGVEAAGDRHLGPDAEPRAAASADSVDSTAGGATAVAGSDPVDTASESYVAVGSDQRIREGDVLTVHGSLQAVNRFVENQGLRQLARKRVTEETFDDAPSDDTLAKAVLPADSRFVGDRLVDTNLRTFYGTTVLAIRRDGELLRTDLGDVELAAGDVLLLQTDADAIEHFTRSTDLLFVDENAFDRLAETDLEELVPLSPKTPLTIAIMVGVIGAAALNLASIVITAFAGVFLMVVTGCLSISDAYEAVSWNIIFLLAGVIPLGIALESTGGSQVIANALVSTADVLPLVAVLLLFTVVTGLLANVITPVATVVLMIPVAVDAAASLGATQFSFLLAVLFASATSFMTPVGYQTNLMVYGPGGYEFTDFLKVGGPLQLLLAVVTTAGIALIWGL